ncbi:MAG: response regulator transcription factor [Clostridiales bacterium]|nr:response regulator transcription factor [Clostridiales bacterium]
MNLFNINILLVDDEPELLSMVKELLSREGFYNIDIASNCRDATARISKGSWQLVLLDVMLPDGNGFELYEKMMNMGLVTDVPVIFLSARDEDVARLKGLGLGADDYITKPFLPEELLLRIKAVLRRAYRLSAEDQNLVLGDTAISFASGEVIRGGSTQMLTAKEHAILLKLSENRGRIVTIDSLCSALWPDGSFGLESSLIVHIRHLREKIEEDPSNPRYLVTVRGLGYKLVK